MDTTEYMQRVNQAVDYIHKNLDKNLTAEEIADYCRFSRFYFNRMFKAIMNESVYSFVKRRKLENAAFLLRAKSNLPVTDIAFRNGYSPSNFASAFKDYHGISPTVYRKKDDIHQKDSYLEVTEHIKSMRKRADCFDEVNNKIKIRKIEKMNLLYERFIGNYIDLAGFWRGFCQKVTEKQLVNENTRFIGVSYDDPLIIDENRCIYDVCINVENGGGPNVHIVEGGYYACYKYHGRVENLVKAYNEIFSIWLPFCGYDVDHRIPLEIYNWVSDGEEGMWLDLDICIPIVKED